MSEEIKTDEISYSENMQMEIDAMQKIHDVLKDIPFDRSKRIIEAVIVLLKP